jgi:hypothetical protein
VSRHDASSARDARMGSGLWRANDKGQLGLDMSRYQELRPEELQRRTTQVALFGTNARLAAGPRRGW